MHAEASMALRDAPAAEASLRRAIEIDPGNPDYLHRLARVLLAMRRPVEAAEHLERAIEHGEPSAALHTELGQVRATIRQYPAAERAFRHALALAPSDEVAGNGLVHALVGQDRPDDALDEARALVQRCPDSAEAHARLAMLLSRAGDQGSAQPHAERAVALRPDHGLARLALGTILFRAGDFHGASDHLSRAHAAAPEPAQRRAIARQLAQALDRAGRCDDAFARFAEAKPPFESLPPEVQSATRDIETFIDACRRDLDQWSLAAWGKSPDYRAFSTPPVFIAGFPRSGVGRLGSLMMTTGRFASAGEGPLLAALRAQIQHVAKGAENIAKHLTEVGEAEVRLFRGFYFNDVEKRLAGTNPIGRRVLDANPGNLIHLAIVRKIFADAPVIVCIRDPRDVVLSAFMQAARTPMDGAFFGTLERAATHYAASMALWLHFKDLLGLRWTESRFEDLLADPAAAARRALDFAGDTAAGLAPIEPPSDRETFAGVGAWKRYRTQLAPVMHLLHPFVDALGYERD